LGKKEEKKSTCRELQKKRNLNTNEATYQKKKLMKGGEKERTIHKGSGEKESLEKKRKVKEGGNRRREGETEREKTN